MITLTVILAGFALFEVLAFTHGAESRPGFDERPERAPYRHNV
ncbi:MAG TPA: hypothetical protein VGV67_15085 [Solirubrobacteraceae bacterium]|nr:hypothetical protein [Solirubrobacteraceae bacterium]